MAKEPTQAEQQLEAAESRIAELERQLADLRLRVDVIDHVGDEHARLAQRVDRLGESLNASRLSGMLISALEAVDAAVCTDRAHEGPPGMGLHRILSAAAAAHMGITVPVYAGASPPLVDPNAPAALVAEPAARWPA